MTCYRENVYLINDGYSDVVIGDLTVPAQSSAQIWSDTYLTDVILLNFTEIYNNIALFNEYIGSESIILNDGTNRTIQEAFNIYEQMKTTYNNSNTLLEQLQIQSLRWSI